MSDIETRVRDLFEAIPPLSEDALRTVRSHSVSPGDAEGPRLALVLSTDSRSFADAAQSSRRSLVTAHRLAVVAALAALLALPAVVIPLTAHQPGRSAAKSKKMANHTGASSPVSGTSKTAAASSLPSSCETGTDTTQPPPPPPSGQEGFEDGSQTLESDFPSDFAGVSQAGGAFTVYETVTDSTLESYARSIFGAAVTFSQAPQSLACLQAVYTKIWQGSHPSQDGLQLGSIGYSGDVLDVTILETATCDSDVAKLQAYFVQAFPTVPITVTGCIIAGALQPGIVTATT
jgi:hypothetical protein